MTVQFQRHLFTVEEFHRMGQAGIFQEDDCVELIAGEIVEMTPVGSKHAACVARLTALLSRVQEHCIVWVQNPIRLGPHSEPQPDVTLVKPRADFYASAHPGPQDVLLLIEVADTSQEYDRRTKVPLYARAGIAEVWLVDLAAGTVEIYRDPSAQGYRQIQTAKRGHPISCQNLPDVQLTVDDILG